MFADSSREWSVQAWIILASSVLLLGTVLGVTGWFLLKPATPKTDGVALALASLGSDWTSAPAQASDCGRHPLDQQSHWVGKSGRVLLGTSVFPTPEQAKTGYDAQVADLARCNTGRYLRSGYQVAGLGGAAIGVTTGSEGQAITTILARQGSFVYAIETTAQVKSAATALAARIGADCPAGAECLVSPEVKPGPPPPAVPAGWLIPADLPLVNPGVGKWVAGTVDAKFNIAFTQCEGFSFDSMTGPTERHHRAYALLDDSAASPNFGIDEVALVFPNESAAKDFAAKLADNVSTCAKRLPVTKVTAETAPGGQPVFQIQQQVENKTIFSRVGVIQAGAKVGYLYANSDEKFDFSSDSWRQIATRAQQRLGQ